MPNVPDLLHDLANLVNTAGLAIQLLAYNKSTPAEISEYLRDLDPHIEAASKAVHEMQKLARDAGLTRSSSSSLPDETNRLPNSAH